MTAAAVVRAARRRAAGKGNLRAANGRIQRIVKVVVACSQWAAMNYETFRIYKRTKTRWSN